MGKTRGKVQGRILPRIREMDHASASPLSSSLRLTHQRNQIRTPFRRIRPPELQNSGCVPGLVLIVFCRSLVERVQSLRLLETETMARSNKRFHFCPEPVYVLPLQADFVSTSSVAPR